jgi:uncharacterized membrane protein YhiD involved in acid resistance
MRLYHLKPIFSTFLPRPEAAHVPQMEQRMPYQIVVICRGSDTAYIEELIRQESCAPDSGIEILSEDLQRQGSLLRIGVHILCPLSQRRALVRLVSRLGLEACVRSVWWQSVPTKLNA